MCCTDLCLFVEISVSLSKKKAAARALQVLVHISCYKLYMEGAKGEKMNKLAYNSCLVRDWIELRGSHFYLLQSWKHNDGNDFYVSYTCSSVCSRTLLLKHAILLKFQNYLQIRITYACDQKPVNLDWCIFILI